MASEQVVPNSSSRKQGHLEAGKKRLEEFRKKKAAKKVALAEQAAPAATDSSEKSPQNENNSSLANDPTSDLGYTSVTSTSEPVGIYQNGPISYSESTYNVPSATAATHASIYGSHGGLLQEDVKDEGSKLYGSSGFSNLDNGYYDGWRENSVVRPTEEYRFGQADSLEKDQSSASKLNAFVGTEHSGFPSLADVLQGSSRDSSATHARGSQQLTSYFSSNISEKSENDYKSDSIFPQTSGLKDPSPPTVYSMPKSSLDYEDTVGSLKGEAKNADVIDHRWKLSSEPWNASNLSSMQFHIESSTSSNQVPFPSTSYPTTRGRSRPSFLDSIGVQRVSSMSEVPYEEPEKTNPQFSFNNSKLESSYSQQQQWQQPSAGRDFMEHSIKSVTEVYDDGKEQFSRSSVLSNSEPKPKQNNESYQNFTAHGKDDDFAALEQLIDDLTQEKFSLQRALETSQTLAESLASDHSGLTDSYNQQGQVISQLKSDMERLQGEIRAQLLALESVKMEYANAQLECSAADERAKVLASEVITLEEKALRLRSNELKLEKQVEHLNSEIATYRRKVSSLEKERQDFQSTIEALQEERKLLHSKLRNVSVTEKANVTTKSTADKKDASTSTEGLDTGDNSIPETLISRTANILENAGPSVSLSSHTSSITSLEHVSCIPEDQLRMIDNINSLMSELAVEREELTRALRIEASNCSKLKELNKDITQKLEVQTQRLELLTAQRMANENILSKPMDTNAFNDATMYADEGDEVVERVLGWIMKLFPGGPKRRTSKLL